MNMKLKTQPTLENTTFFLHSQTPYHLDCQAFQPYTHFYHRPVKKITYLSDTEVHYQLADNQEVFSLRAEVLLRHYYKNKVGLSPQHQLKPSIMGVAVKSIEFLEDRALYTLETGIKVNAPKIDHTYQDDDIAIAG